MAKKPKPIHVLLIDDETEYCKTLVARARRDEILITAYQNLEDGFRELENNTKYQGLILDGRCFTEASQETVRDNFIAEALMRLERLKSERGWHIITVINSAYIDELKNYIPDKIPQFNKGENNEAMFRHLRDEINRSEEMEIKNKYRKPFEIFEKGYLDHQVEHDLLTIFKDMTNDDPAIVARNLARLRTSIEAIFTQMNKINKKVVPDYLINENIAVRKIIKHLSGNAEHNPAKGYKAETSTIYIPKHIKNILYSCYSITSDEGNHYSDAKLTRYAVMNVTFGICEFLVWFGDWMDNEIK